LCRDDGGAFDELLSPPGLHYRTVLARLSMQLQDDDTESNRERLPSRVERSFWPSRICRPYERDMIVVRGEAACLKQEIGNLG
jgi:hypothetical protein